MAVNPRWVPRIGAFRSWNEPWHDALDLMRDAVDFRGRLCITCGAPLHAASLVSRRRVPTGRLYCSRACRSTQAARRQRLRDHLTRFGAACPMCGSFAAEQVDRPGHPKRPECVGF